ncbi:hypothetical protein BRD18_02055 [Halobacteriales archaeon SW_7_71_33]|nr:MAG: hypothetical protein BRD18_02055 [Halobacteriales archaeon SW_7_71_33]
MWLSVSDRAAVDGDVLYRRVGTGSMSDCEASTGRGRRWPRVAGAFALGLAVAGAVLWVVGPAALSRAVGRVSTRRLVSLAVVGAVPTVVWGGALHLVFRRFGVARRPTTSVLLFAAANFMNTVTPFGQVGGDPPSALLFERALDAEFETSLAAVASVNALNAAAALVLGLVGVASLRTRVALGGVLETAAATAVAVVAVVVVVAVVARRHWDRLVRSGRRSVDSPERPVCSEPSSSRA